MLAAVMYEGTGKGLVFICFIILILVVVAEFLND